MTQTPSSSPAPLLQIITDYPMAQVIQVAAQLRLADLLAAGPRRDADRDVPVLEQARAERAQLR